ncbi:hypothetical protein ACVILH_006463 [Bradyrhizobium sp. USDA 4353]
MRSVRSADRHGSGLDWGFVPRWSPFRGRTFFSFSLTMGNACVGAQVHARRESDRPALRVAYVPCPSPGWLRHPTSPREGRGEVAPRAPRSLARQCAHSHHLQRSSKPPTLLEAAMRHKRRCAPSPRSSRGEGWGEGQRHGWCNPACPRRAGRGFAADNRVTKDCCADCRDACRATSSSALRARRRCRRAARSSS